MIRTLIWKEFRQHWAAVIVLFLLSLAGLVLIAAWSLQGDFAGSSFEALRIYVGWFLPLAALLLGNRLVVAEFSAGTQLFLESLPVSRTRMIAVKFVLGFLAMGTLFATALGASILFGFRHEVLSAKFIGFIALRSLGYLFPVYALAFLMGMLGRYRIPLYVLLLIGLFTVDNFDLFDLGDFGPFALLDDRFAYERTEFPWHRLGEAGALGAGFLLLTWLLTVVREGDVSTMLSEKMSLREKVFVSVALLGVFMMSSAFLERRPPAPFDLPDAEAAADERAVVKVEGGNADVARALARELHSEVSRLAGHLGIDRLQPVFVVHFRSLDYDVFEEAELPENEGFLVRANFTANGFDSASLLEWLVPRLLIKHTDGRAGMEHVRWLLDGLAHHWLTVHSELGAEEAAQRENHLVRRARVALATVEPLSHARVEGWFALREELGPPLAEALSWSLLEAIRRQSGDAALAELLRRTVARKVPKDIRALFLDPAWRRWTILRETSGMNPDELVAEAARIAATQEGPSQEGSSPAEDDSPSIVPSDLACEVELVSDSAGTARLHYRIKLDPADERAASDPSRELVFRYAEIAPFNAPIDETDVREIATETSTGEVADSVDRSFPRGSRIACQAAVFSEQLDCRIFTPWRRLDVGAPEP